MNKKRLITVSAKSSAGKDTIVKMLKKISKDFEFDIELKEVVSYSTRGKRANEVNGREHIFITDKEADELLESKEILAYTKIGDYKYFVTMDQLKDSNIYIIDPYGIKSLESDHPEIELFKIYIKTPFIKRVWRARKRSDFKTAYFKRVKSEYKQFHNYEKEKNYDLLINNSKQLDIHELICISSKCEKFIKMGLK